MSGNPIAVKLGDYWASVVPMKIGWRVEKLGLSTSIQEVGHALFGGLESVASPREAILRVSDCTAR